MNYSHVLVIHINKVDFDILTQKSTEELKNFIKEKIKKQNIISNPIISAYNYEDEDEEIFLEVAFSSMEELDLNELKSIAELKWVSFLELNSLDLISEVVTRNTYDFSEGEFVVDEWYKYVSSTQMKNPISWDYITVYEEEIDDFHPLQIINWWEYATIETIHWIVQEILNNLSDEEDKKMVINDYEDVCSYFWTHNHLLS